MQQKKDFFHDERAKFAKLLVDAFIEHRPRYCVRMVTHRGAEPTKCGKKAKQQHGTSWFRPISLFCLLSCLFLFYVVVFLFYAKILIKITFFRYCGTVSNGCYKMVLGQEERSRKKEEKEKEKEEKKEEKAREKAKKAADKQERAKVRAATIKATATKARAKEEESNREAKESAAPKKKKRRTVPDSPPDTGPAFKTTGRDRANRRR